MPGVSCHNNGCPTERLALGCLWTAFGGSLPFSLPAQIASTEGADTVVINANTPVNISETRDPYFACVLPSLLFTGDASGAQESEQASMCNLQCTRVSSSTCCPCSAAHELLWAPPSVNCTARANHCPEALDSP